MDPAYGNVQESPTLAAHVIEFFQTFAIFAAILAVVYFLLIQPHRVSGLSMYPTFHDQDLILTDKISYRFVEPERGDVIVFASPTNENEDFIKRIIGLPGDRVKVQGGRVYLNGNLLEEPYLQATVVTEWRSFLTEGKEVVVPDDNYIVFGDNRPGSSDSREWGFMPKSNIVGKALVRYWPITDAQIIPHYSLP